MDLTVIIPFFNGEAYLDRLVMSLSRTTPVLAVDDHSAAPLDPNLTNKKYRNVKVIRPHRKGFFAGAVNAGLEATTGDVLILNQDVWFDEGAFAGLLAKLANLDEKTAIAGDGVFGHPAWPMGYVQGTVMFLRREAIHDVGLLNDEVFPLWGGTAEWQLRAVRRGWKAEPWREIPGFRHERAEGEAFGSAIQSVLDQMPEEKARFVRTPPLVSVIIPTYNHGRYLTDAVNSIIGGMTTPLGYTQGQTLAATEVIIVDDVSTDDTKEIGESLADPWKGVRYIRRNVNGGTPAANNTGIAAAYGRYITILCADDVREAGSLERMWKAAEANPHSLIYDDVLLYLHGSGREKVWELPDYDFDRLLERNFIHAGIMVPRKALEEIGGYPERMLYGREDWAVNVALGVAGYCGVHIKEPGYVYRRHDANRTLSNSNEEWRETFVAQMRGLFPEIYEGVRPMACCGRKDPQIGGSAFQSNSLIGSTGMTSVTYQGGNYGEETYYGPVTGQQYRFSMLKPTRLVDSRDLRAGGRGLLEIFENGQFVFQTTAKPAAPVITANDLPPDDLVRNVSPTSLPAPIPDDLTQIAGVGRETAAKLAQFGFTTFQAVAALNPERVAVVLGIPKSRLEKIKAAAGDLVKTDASA